MGIRVKWLVWSGLLVVALLCGCSVQPVTTPPAVYSQYQLEYRLIAGFTNVFWTDPDLYPVAREGQEQANALQQFVAIRANDVAFSAILEHLGLDRRDTYTNEEKVLVYRQQKMLAIAVQMTPLNGGAFRFVLRIGEGQGERVEGTIAAAGTIVVEKREPSFNSHPICLAKGTLIDTPHGAVPVEDVFTGMMVWTADAFGRRLAAPVLQVGSTAVPAAFRVISLALDDGRTIRASPGHPTAEGRPLGDCRVGDRLDGGVVVEAELAVYPEGETYDILPAGGAGLYWANGILLQSTVEQR
jgi:hypothetical protein